MPLNFTTIAEHDLSGGIDARSSENLIAPSYSEDILNADIIEKRLQKRVGYQGVGGCIPLRVQQLTYDLTDNLMKFQLDGSIDLTNIRSTPIVVYGRTSLDSHGGDFTSTDSGNYYGVISTDPRIPLTAPSGTITIGATSHGFSSSNFFVGTAISTSPTLTDNNIYIPNLISIDKSTYELEIDYSLFANQESFVYFLEKNSLTGSIYIDDTLAVGIGDNTFNITAGTHGLSNFQLIPKLYKDTGTDWEQVIPDSLIIDTNGDIEIQINGVISAYTGKIILTTVPDANFKTAAASSGQSISFTLTNTNSYIFYGLYEEDIGTGDKELVIPDSIIYDDTNNLYTISLTNNTASSKNYEFYYEFGTVKSNVIEVTPDSAITSGGTDTVPQMTLWGICHDNIYNNQALNRAGWVNHIDSYKRSAEQRLISGLGGNLFGLYNRLEINSNYLLPIAFPNLRGRMASETVISSCFHDDGDTPERTRGYITATNMASNFGTITDVNWISGNNVKYTFNMPGLAILDSTGTPTTIGAVISTTSNLEDHITIKQTGYSAHNGTFKIVAVASGVDTIEVTVENSLIDSADWDETDVGGLGGIFTDQIPFTSSSRLLEGDNLTSDIFGTNVVNVVSSLGAIVVIDGMVDTISVPAGITIIAKRTSSVIPVRDDVTSMVAGDTLFYSEVDRNIQIVNINPLSDITVSIVGDGTNATVTLGSGDTTSFFDGEKLLLLEAGEYTGIISVGEILSSTTFSFTSTLSSSETGCVLVGNTIEIDEELTFSDNVNDTNTLTIAERWIPIEAPDDIKTITPYKYVNHFTSNEYTNKSFIRSTMVNDNLYLTNGEDEVLKFDGANIYRAGFPRWQAGFLAIADETATAKIEISEITATVTAIDQNKLTVGAGKQSKFKSGDEVVLDSKTFFVDSVFEESGSGIVKLTQTAVGLTLGDISKVQRYYYYFRLNAIDANNNIIASAVTGNEDFIVKLTESAAINIKLTEFPAWDIYDYSRIEVEIYRTALDIPAPYYKIVTLPLNFLESSYIEYTDTTADSELSEADLDPVNSALLGAELGTQWTEPPRAKYLTSANNRLILGNIKDYPQLDVVLGSGADESTLVGNIFTFNKDNTATGSVTDLDNTINYEIVDDSAKAQITAKAYAGTTITYTSAGHTLAVDDWVYIYAFTLTANKTTHGLGWYRVIGISGNDFDVTDPVNNTDLPTTTYFVTASDTTDIPVLVSDEANRGSLVDGNATSTSDEKNIAVNRMAEAINATIRFASEPWMIASSDGSYGIGQLVVRQPKVIAQDGVLEMTLPSSFTYDLFVNNKRRLIGEVISASTKSFRSRVVVSYENYPEIFDNPYTVLPQNSDSIIDVNPADGQEITGIIPFFGDSSFGGASKSGVVVIFKTNSIYLTDIEAKSPQSLESRLVQKLETQGLGCTAPYSIASTKDGIMFANESGMYRLKRDLTIEYIGRFMERNWDESVNKDYLDICQGHHYGIGKRYKLSVPTNTDTSNSEVYVYHHTGENAAKVGGWTRYDNHPTTGWANLGSGEYFSTTKGRINEDRSSGETTDFRDGSSAIICDIKYRALDFGYAGIRKVFGALVSHFRAIAESDESTVTFAVDLKDEFNDMDSFIITATTSTSLGDIANNKVQSIRNSLERRRGIYLQLRYKNTGYDEPFEIAGFDVAIAPLNSRGIKEAADTGG